MNNRDQRKQIAEDTLHILKEGTFTNPQGQQIDISDVQASAEEHTVLYTPEMSDHLLAKYISNSSAQTNETKITVTRETTLDAVRRLLWYGSENVCYLNFASAKNPGGGFLGGSQAQEESIARSTGLYNCQLKAIDYYDTNRQTKSCFYTDCMIYSPDVPIIKDEAGNNLDRLMKASIITAPAVNTGVVKHREPHRLTEVEAVMKRRIKKVLTIALEHRHDTIVLGAWGCGVFQNNPEDIALYFHEVIKNDFPNAFKEIVFAIYARNERFVKPFWRMFGKANNLNTSQHG